MNNIASGVSNYAIGKTIKRQVRKQIARTHLLSKLCSTCSSALSLTRDQCVAVVVIVVVVIALVVVDWFGKAIKMSKITQISH